MGSEVLTKPTLRLYDGGLARIVTSPLYPLSVAVGRPVGFRPSMGGRMDKVKSEVRDALEREARRVKWEAREEISALAKKVEELADAALATAWEARLTDTDRSELETIQKNARRLHRRLHFGIVGLQARTEKRQPLLPCVRVWVGKGWGR